MLQSNDLKTVKLTNFSRANYFQTFSWMNFLPVILILYLNSKFKKLLHYRVWNQRKSSTWILLEVRFRIKKVESLIFSDLLLYCDKNLDYSNASLIVLIKNGHYEAQNYRRFLEIELEVECF